MGKTDVQLFLSFVLEKWQQWGFLYLKPAFIRKRFLSAESLCPRWPVPLGFCFPRTVWTHRCEHADAGLVVAVRLSLELEASCGWLCSSGPLLPGSQWAVAPPSHHTSSVSARLNQSQTIPGEECHPGPKALTVSVEENWAQGACLAPFFKKKKWKMVQESFYPSWGHCVHVCVQLIYLFSCTWSKF